MKIAISIVLTLAFFVVGTSATAQASKESLVKHLLKTDMSNVSPRMTQNSSIMVDMEMPHITPRFDEAEKLLDMKSEVVFRWTDVRLKWKPRDFGDVSELTDDDFDKTRIWHPLIYIFNDYEQQTKCEEVDIKSSGKVSCSIFQTLGIRCSSANREDFPVNEYKCYVSIFSWTRVNLTCNGKWDYCFHQNAFEQDGIWKYEVMKRRVYQRTLTGSENYHTKAAIISLKRIRPVSTIIYAPTILLGCVVLVQWLLLLKSQERIFLNVALTFASILVIVSIHSIPAVMNGAGAKILRMACSVTLINCASMTITVLTTNFLQRITLILDLNTKVSNFFQLIRMSIFLPTLVKFPDGENDQWLSLSITLDRILFLISSLIFIIIALVP